MHVAIARLFRHDGPFVTAYLDARSDQPQAQQVLQHRWKSLRSELAGQGAPEEDLAAVDDELTRRDHKGGDTLALVATGGHVVFARHLPEPPVRDRGRFDALPWVGPLLDAAQTMVPHLVVVADRTGAHLWGVTQSGQELEEDVRGSTNEDTEKVSAGGWSQRRFQTRAVHTWEENAAEVAAEVADLAKHLAARLVAVSGDVHAVRLLREALPADVAGLVREVQGDDPVQVTHLVSSVVAEETTALLREFKEERGQSDRAADGPARTVEALQAAVVRTLLLHDDPDDDRRAWFGPEPGHLALDRATLEAMGVDEPREGRLVDVCVRAAMGTSADVRVVPKAVLSAGLGAVLRHTGNRPG